MTRVMTTRMAIAMSWLMCFTTISLADEAAHTTDVTELTNSEYWSVRYASMMLDIALAQHQPDLAIHYALDDPIRQSAGLSTQFPKDSEVTALHKKMQETDTKLDLSDLTKNAFSKSCPWLTTSFGDTWEHFHMAEELCKAGRKDDAADELASVKAGLKYLDDPNVMKEWPDELKKSVENIRSRTAELEKQVKS